MILADEQPGVDAVRDHYDRISVFYRALWGDHIHHGFWEDGESPSTAQVKLIERLAARIQIERGSRVLDVGCGVGGSSLWLAREFDCSVRGLTISPVQAAMAREKAGAEGLGDRVSFEVADANHLDIVPGSFDVVWIVECSEHIADKERFIGRCARSLRPGGVLALCAWLASDDPALTSHKHLLKDVCGGMLCPSLASMSDYTGWMSASGFELIEAEEITRHVKETWTRCAALARRTEVKALLSVSDARTRRFVETFSAIQQAYEVGAMGYGMFTARKAGE
ncbi:MAG: class I SAM-dependent methyltransferase [Acidobacteria bacterium]|nr:class I SAM-dependent methyltransferase [Acidobacteriota bacterium]